MYCVKCGIELSDGQLACPVCKTKVCHPDFSETKEIPLYPRKEFQSEEINIKGLLFIISIICVVPILVSFILDWNLSGKIVWSGFVLGGILLAYISGILPLWFKNPNPVIFVPCAFGALAVFLLYINYETGGSWYMTLALPVTLIAGAITIAVVTLVRYIRRGRLYIAGGALIVTGGSMMLLEYFVNTTFDLPAKFIWSLYPLATLCLFGIMVIVIEIVKPFKESLRKIFFI